MWNPLLVVPLQAVATILVADFVSGAVRWAEDAYARPDLPLIGGLLIATTWGLGCLTWQVGLFALVTANANQIHKWAHRNPRENASLVTWLQTARILQTPRHHAQSGSMRVYLGCSGGSIRVCEVS